MSSTTSSDALTVAVAQAVSTAGDVVGNAAVAAELVRLAGADGADLVVLPELFLPGYDLVGLGARPERDLDVGSVDGDNRLEALRRACDDTGATALVGASVRRGHARRLSVLRVGPDGAVDVPYDKQHLSGGEVDVFTPGERGAVVEVGGWPVGLGVCYDGCFPEHARAAARAGALLYACGAAYAEGAEERRDLYYRARALDNTMFVAMAGLVGRCGSGRFGGGSQVLGPEGEVLVAAADEPRAVLTVRLEHSRLDEVRARHPMLADAAD